MNEHEILEFRKNREAKFKLSQTAILQARGIKARHAQDLGIKVLSDYPSPAEKEKQINVYKGHAKAAHFMMKALIEIPPNDKLSEIQSEKGPGAFTVYTREVKTPDLGLFEVGALIWNDTTIDNTATKLNLDLVHPIGPYPNPIPGDETHSDRVIDTCLDDLNFRQLQRISNSSIADVSSSRETVAEVCAQVGIEIVPTNYEAEQE